MGTPPGPHPEASGYQFPTSVALDGSGNLFLFTGDTTLTQWAVSGNATGIALDTQGNVYVAEPYAHQIGKFSPEGQTLATFDLGSDASGQPEQPIALAVDAEGFMYDVDGGMLRLSPQGDVLARWPQSQTATPPGQFAMATSVALDGQGNVTLATKVPQASKN
jgi:streptogramin lyase